MIPNYTSVLRKNGIRLDAEELQRTDVSALDSECILALITGAILQLLSQNASLLM